MAKQKNQTPESEEHIDNEFYTNRGDLELRFGFKTYEYDEDGRDITKKVTEHVESSQGTFVGPGDIMRRGAGKTGLATCDKCEEEIHSFFMRSKFKTSLSPAVDMRRCHICRANLCQRHFFVGKDRRIRCHRHHRWYSFIENVVRPLIWKRF